MGRMKSLCVGGLSGIYTVKSSSNLQTLSIMHFARFLVSLIIMYYIRTINPLVEAAAPSQMLEEAAQGKLHFKTSFLMDLLRS